MGISVEFDFEKDEYKILPFDIDCVTNIVKKIVLCLIFIKLLSII